MRTPSIPVKNEDESDILEGIVGILHVWFGHSEEAAIELLERFYHRFPPPEPSRNPLEEVRSRNDLFDWQDDFVACRVQYFEALGNSIDDEGDFLQFYIAARNAWAAECHRKDLLHYADQARKYKRVRGWEDEMRAARNAVNWCLVARHYDMALKTRYPLELPLSVDLKDVNRQLKQDDAAVKVTIRLALD